MNIDFHVHAFWVNIESEILQLNLARMLISTSIAIMLRGAHTANFMCAIAFTYQSTNLLVAFYLSWIRSDESINLNIISKY